MQKLWEPLEESQTTWKKLWRSVKGLRSFRDQTEFWEKFWRTEENCCHLDSCEGHQLGLVGKSCKELIIMITIIITMIISIMIMIREEN